MSELRVLKLVTGEEILTEVTDNSDGTISIENSILIALQPKQDGSGGFGIALLPHANYVDGPITFQTKHVIWNEPPVPELASQHHNIFNKIVTPPKGLVVPK